MPSLPKTSSPQKQIQASINEESSSEEEILPEHFTQANAMIESIPTPSSSHPTKSKVKNFKNRVFHLIKIYAEKSSSENINSVLIPCLKQEMFTSSASSESDKIRELIGIVLNKQNIGEENLQRLAEHYSVMIMYGKRNGGRNSGNSSKSIIVDDFVRILKKLSSVNEQKSKEVIVSMLKNFAYKRKCTLHVEFFFSLLRKFNKIRNILKESCIEMVNDEQLRGAQKKQINKLLNKIHHKEKTNQQKAKKEEVQDLNENDVMDLEDDDQIQPIIIKRQKEQEIDGQRTSEFGEIEQNQGLQDEGLRMKAQKLKRIKANKKKRKHTNNSIKKIASNSK